MTWYRCRAEVGDGEYVSYIGPQIDEALNSLGKHPHAQTVVVERRAPGGSWEAISGVWRKRRD